LSCGDSRSLTESSEIANRPGLEWIVMQKLALATLAAALAAAPAAAAQRPVSGAALLAIDRRAGFRNYLPTRLPVGFAYASWSAKGQTLTVRFRSKAGPTVVWTVAPMTGACDTGSRRASSSRATRSGGRRTRKDSARGAASSRRTASRCA
jgi:hypothetical protein